MRLLLFSDLHLDTRFQWAGARVARARRRRLRDALGRVVTLSQELRVDAVLCGGDLYEQSRFTPDTVSFVQRAFERLHPIRVFVAPGNHDWYGAGSLYRRAQFSPNVHVFTRDRLERVALDDGLSLWGAAHRAPANTDGFLDGFRVDGGGIHLALFHGSERSSLFAQEKGKQPHAPFEAAQIERSGLHHAFLGHYHQPSDAERFTYPGNPAALTFGESGERGAVVATIAADGSVQRERERLCSADVHDLEVDVSGCSDLHEVRERVEASLSGLAGVARVTLLGELASQVDLRPHELFDLGELDLVRVRIAPGLRVAYDYDAIAHETTVRGQFVRDVREDPGLDEEARRAVLVTGLRALEGRDDLEAL